MERATSLVELAAGRVEYRLERRGPRVVLMLHGGHMRAGLPLGEDVFADADCTVLAVSRPGYGRTPLATGPSPERFADALHELCGELGIGSVAAAVGQSAGGHTALTLAARHPGLVERVILESAVGLLPWPDRRTRAAAGVAFHPHTERATWGLMHVLMRRVPGLGLRALLPDLTRRRAGEVLAGLDSAQKTALLELFGRMRSGSGFANDVRTMSSPDHLRSLTDQAAGLRQPALVIATRDDGSVPYAHAESLTETIPHARLVTSTAPSHMIWIAPDYPEIATTITNFLHRPLP